MSSRFLTSLLIALSLAGCSPDPSGDKSPALPRGLPDASRCESFVARYQDALIGSQACDRDDDCAFELRGKLFTGLDGCFRISNRRFDLGKADAAASEWLDTGCASTYELCPSTTAKAICNQGFCKELPPSPIPTDWVRVDVEHAVTVFVPPDLIEERVVRECGNGPALRLFRGPGLDVRIEYGYELSPLPIDDDGSGSDYPPRSITRTKKTIAPYQATLLTFEKADVTSRDTAVDGSWPRYRWVRALLVRGLDDRMRSGFLDLGQGTGHMGMVIVIEGERAHREIAARMLDTVSFW